MRVANDNNFSFIVLLSVSAHLLLLLSLIFIFKPQVQVEFHTNAIEVVAFSPKKEKSEVVPQKADTTPSPQQTTPKVFKSQQTQFKEIKSSKTDKSVEKIEDRLHSDPRELIRNREFSSLKSSEQKSAVVNIQNNRDINPVIEKESTTTYKKNSSTQSAVSQPEGKLKWDNPNNARRALNDPSFDVSHLGKVPSTVVIIRIRVNSAGRVVSAIVDTPSVLGEIDRLAKEHATKYLFEPVEAGISDAFGKVVYIIKSQ